MKKSLFMLLLLLFAVQMHAQPTIHYVIPGGTGGGTSWQDGGDLAQMLTQAQDNDEVWVMQGYYTLSPVVIYNSISVYGGFTGTENHPDMRPPLLLSRSVVDLSQNTGMVPSISVNFYPGPPNFYFLPSINHFVMDGFILYGATTSNNWGGALRVESVEELHLRNLYVYNCQATNGGGMYLDDIRHGYMENVFFNNNFADNFGGGLFLSFCTDFTMVNTAFTNNYADCIYSPSQNCTVDTYGSGGVFIESSNVVVHNMTATNNGTDTLNFATKRHAYKAGCITGSNVAFYNSIIYPDTMNIEYNYQKTVSYDQCCLWTTQHIQLIGVWYDSYLDSCYVNPTSTVIESNIFSANPLFDFGTYNPFPYLQPNSPCIDAGSYSCGTLYDLFGNFRVTGIDADLGAMEYQQ
ncbi:MAG: hypothetical protein J6Y34_03620 [Bacteroidales bacterium]|nr:hypothetical protein [Bacteroidales bacterium]